MTCLNWWDGVLPVLDFEATGTDPESDRIVSAALVLCMPRGGTLPGGVVTLVNPGVPIPPEASAIHGITDEMVADHPTAAEVILQILRCLVAIEALGWPLVIYNATYDWPLLHAEAARHGWLAIPEVPIIDPLVLDRYYDRFRPGGRKLGDVCRHYGVELLDAHDALSDAVAAAELCRAIVRRYPELQQMDFRALHDLQADMHAAWLRSFNEYRRRRGHEPIPDVQWPGVLASFPADVMLTLRCGRDQDDTRAFAAPVELDELREPWGDVPAVPEASLVRQRRYPPVPAGALRAYRRWLACED